MTDQSDIFSGADSTNTAPTTANMATPPAVTAADPITELLTSIRNEEGLQKYASVHDALKGASHAQEFIKQLKQEKLDMENRLRELQGEVTKRTSVEDAMSMIASKREPQHTTAQGLDREDVYSLMKEYETTKQLESNRKLVNEKLINYFGGEDKARQAVQERIAELGLSSEDLQSLAMSSPKAVYKVFGLEDKQGLAIQKNSKGTFSTDAVLSSSQYKEEPKHRPLKVGATGKDLLNAWRAAGANLNNN